MAPEEAGTAPCLQVTYKSFNRRTKSERQAQCWLQAAFSCPATEPLRTGRTSGHNICLDFTAPSAQTFSLKLLIKGLPSPVPLLSPSPCWPQSAPGTSLVPFFPQFSFTVCIFFSILYKSLLLPVAYHRERGVSPTVCPLFLIFYPNFCAPREMALSASELLSPCPLTLPSFCWIFPLVSPNDLPQLSPVPPLPPCICICFREASCCLEAALDSRGPKAKWRFGYSSSMSRWKEPA